MTAISPDPTLVDPTRRHLRAALALGLPCLAAAATIALGLASGGLPGDGSAPATAAIIALVVLGAGGVVAVALFLAILASARKTARIYARLGGGGALADWRFEPGAWAAFIEAEHAEDRWTAVGFVVVFAFVVGVTGYAAYPDLADAADWTGPALFVGGVGLLLAVIYALVRWFGRRKLATMRGRPRVVILDDAVYCGGVLHRWGERMIVLRRVDLKPGPPAALEMTVGESDGVRGVTAVLGILSLFAGRSAPRTPDTTFRVPVPADRMAEAEALAARLLARRG